MRRSVNVWFTAAGQKSWQADADVSISMAIGSAGAIVSQDAAMLYADYFTQAKDEITVETVVQSNWYPDMYDLRANKGEKVFISTGGAGVVQLILDDVPLSA